MSPAWRRIATFVLRQRIPILITILALTGVMWVLRGTKVSQTLSPVIPYNHPDAVNFRNFKATFGDDGATLAVGLEGEVFSLRFFQGLYDLSRTLQQSADVKSVLSLSNLIDLGRDDSLETFRVVQLVTRRPETQAEVDSIRRAFERLPFFRGMLLDEAGKTTLMVVQLDPVQMNTKRKVEIVNAVKKEVEAFAKPMGIEPRYAGLPVLRANIHQTVTKELVLFLIISLVIMAITLLLFFRSFTTMIFPILVVGMVIIWSVGIIGILGYEITLITGIIPALITVISIPNCVYLITKYHIEYLRTRNKIKSLVLVIQKIGIAAVMTNATTAAGLLTIAFTNIKALQEFGIVGSLSVLVAFVISLMMIPIIFSFLPAPTPNQTRHLQRRTLDFVIRGIDYAVRHYRPAIFVMFGVLIVLSLVGISQIKTLSYMADDIPKGSKVLKDLRFVEDRFQGALPFEILIDTKKKRGALNFKNLNLVKELQDSLASLPQISRTLSAADFVQFGRQALMGGGESDYMMPSRNEYNFIQLYVKNISDSSGSGLNLANRLTDSARQVVRVTATVKDLGSLAMDSLVTTIRADLNAIFDTAQYHTVITGTTPVFVTSNKFLVNNLAQSLVLAFVLIGGLMALLFRNGKMIFVSILPNTLPLLMVAGIMGFADIHLKASTILVFGIAFGIAVDTTIHFLIRYRLARGLGDSAQGAISNSLRDTGVGILYTSLVLFIGFVSFTASEFGGTQALGLLMSLTLIIAMFANLFFLPALLMWMDGKKD
jgi:hypothetical protein